MDRQTVVVWDREKDVPATDDLVATIVDLLWVGFAGYTYEENRST